MENITENEQLSNSELPWIIFKLKNNLYAVNSKYINGIEMKTDDLTPMPEAPDCYRGLRERRGEVFPIIDLRRLFGIDTVDDEVTAFRSMMEKRKQEHLNWVSTLEDCVRSNKKFTLAADPHKCAFGRWYYSFIEDNHSAGFHIKKIEEPHRLLHETAPKALAAASRGNLEEADALLKVARKVYIPKIIAVLDEAENAFRDTFRETVIVITGKGKQLGLIVDDVIDIGRLNPVTDGDKVNLLSHSKYLTSVARNRKTNHDIFVINEAELLGFADIR